MLVASCTYAGGGPDERAALALRFERSLPVAGARDVPLDATFDLYFSAPLAPEAEREGSVALHSGLVHSSLRLRVDLLENRLRARPDVLLRPNLDYTLQVPAELPALDGSRLAQPLLLVFTTGSGRSRRTAAAPPPTASELQPLWVARCVDGCHATTRPRAGLDLSSPASALRDLRGVRSAQLGLQRVAPGDHARSYLLRKLLPGAPRLGLPMPPTGAPLERDELRRIADWIDGGALP